ncbi:MAG: hypothetical protein N2110_08705 [Flavobacteriales bacterium]|nr:hypothetical protein [Flavobacteriales bacterium]MCX7769083.1 hypothetical protein [Flavobacteriales bacterium]MDW8410459.1 hypothetical protein [Flavobacteriales bacterium]
MGYFLDPALLESAIRKAETGCGAEFAVVSTRASGRYNSVTGPVVLAVQGVTLLALTLAEKTDVWGQWHWLQDSQSSVIILLCTGLVAFLVLWFWPRLRVWLAPSREKAAQVREAALAVFADAGLACTSHRRTVLVFVSELERRIDIVVDMGLREVFPEHVIIELEKEWSARFRKKTHSATIASLLDHLAKTVAGAGFGPGSLSAQELSDKPLQR